MKISMLGCCLVDRIYNNISFNSPAFTFYFSKEQGDGGLLPGHLVFEEEFEKFCQKDFLEVLREITLDKEPDKKNIGGPGIVALIHAAQILNLEEFECHFYGSGGHDSDGEFILSQLRPINLSMENYSLSDNSTPSTIVLSDPDYDQGQGERIFINSIGAAWDYTQDKVDDHFYQSEIICLGGTALVPKIHDQLGEILKKAKDTGNITFVNTVYDFHNEKNNPGQPWPLGKSKSFELIDVLVMSREEAIKISGEKSIDESVRFFISSGVSSFIITGGASEVIAYSDGGIFKATDGITCLPVSDKVKSELNKIPSDQRDTTGCGDNFAGGLLASLAEQLSQKSPGELDLFKAVALGIVSGGFTCFIVGGTYYEKFPGEKGFRIKALYEDYLVQVGIK